LNFERQKTEIISIFNMLHTLRRFFVMLLLYPGTPKSAPLLDFVSSQTKKSMENA